MKTEGTSLRLLTIPASWSSSRWPLGHLDELQKADKYPIRWSLETGFTVDKWHSETVLFTMYVKCWSPPYLQRQSRPLSRHSDMVRPTTRVTDVTLQNNWKTTTASVSSSLCLPKHVDGIIIVSVEVSFGPKGTKYKKTTNQITKPTNQHVIQWKQCCLSKISLYMARHMV